MVLAAAMYTLGSVTVPSLASVYNELALKKHMDTSIDLQNWYKPHVLAECAPVRVCVVQCMLAMVCGLQ